MSLVISDDVLQASGLRADELFLEVILLLFQKKKLSLGKSAELLDMSQFRFQQLIAERGICVHYDVADFQEDVQGLMARDGFNYSLFIVNY